MTQTTATRNPAIEYQITEVHHDGRRKVWTGRASDIIAAAKRMDGYNYITYTRAELEDTYDHDHDGWPNELRDVWYDNPDCANFVEIVGDGIKTGDECYYAVDDAPDELDWAIEVCGHDLQSYTVEPIND